MPIFGSLLGLYLAYNWVLIGSVFCLLESLKIIGSTDLGKPQNSSLDTRGSHQIKKNFGHKGKPSNNKKLSKFGKLSQTFFEIFDTKTWRQREKSKLGHKGKPSNKIKRSLQKNKKRSKFEHLGKP